MLWKATHNLNLIWFDYEMPFCYTLITWQYIVIYYIFIYTNLSVVFTDVGLIHFNFDFTKALEGLSFSIKFLSSSTSFIALSHDSFSILSPLFLIFTSSSNIRINFKTSVPKSNQLRKKRSANVATNKKVKLLWLQWILIAIRVSHPGWYVWTAPSPVQQPLRFNAPIGPLLWAVCLSDIPVWFLAKLTLP